MSGLAPPRFAVVFKTHVWDPFIARQYERYRAVAGSGDLHVCFDETNGATAPTDARVMRFRVPDLLALGLADRAERGSVIWWNTDYPHYLFYERYPDYDYYLFCEYDTCIRRGLDGLMAAVAEAGADFVALPTRAAKQDWMWTPLHLGTYDYDSLTGSLNCVCILSNQALRLLRDRRLAMSREAEAGGVPFWPVNEVFLATEVKRAGLKTASLEQFGGAADYEWYPPHLEEDLDGLPAASVFLHPVLDRERYMASLLKFSPLPAYVIPQTRLGRALRRFPQYYGRVPRAFLRRLRMRSVEAAQDIGARLRWRLRGSMGQDARRPTLR